MPQVPHRASDCLTPPDQACVSAPRVSRWTPNLLAPPLSKADSESWGRPRQHLRLSAAHLCDGRGSQAVRLDALERIAGHEAAALHGSQPPCRASQEVPRDVLPAPAPDRPH